MGDGHVRLRSNVLSEEVRDARGWRLVPGRARRDPPQGAPRDRRTVLRSSSTTSGCTTSRAVVRSERIADRARGLRRVLVRAEPATARAERRTPCAGGRRARGGARRWRRRRQPNGHRRAGPRRPRRQIRARWNRNRLPNDHRWRKVRYPAWVQRWGSEGRSARIADIIERFRARLRRRRR